ncbi:FadD3 family acyl-CoA ligase [Frankia gtarii]|uniref:FadD3 family acyl-CoA ligase n=1 Tax=Frankia gtarii TaxID=2950102 RepID=UPI0021C12F5B|nr:FadD3 family acyl-CoA ligase [Frankia gtarii]
MTSAATPRAADPRAADTAEPLAAASAQAVPPTIPAALAAAARRWPGDEAIVDGDIRLTFAGLADQAARVAAALVASDVRPGDRVAIWAPNIHEWVSTALGVYQAGAVLVPVNTRFKGPEAAAVLRSSGAEILFTVGDFLGVDYVRIVQNEPDLPALRKIVALRGEGRPGVPSWSAFLDLASGDPALSREVQSRAQALGPADLSDIVFTSGTTGAPKGAMLTHGASTGVYTAWAEVVGLRPGDRYLLVYPFFHCAGLKSGLLACLLVGATLVPHPVFDVPSVLRRVTEERITMLPGPPAVYQTILAADRSGYDLSSLRLAVTGAAAVPVTLVRRMRAELNLETVLTGYGLTETTGTATMCRHDDDPATVARTSGRAIPGVEVRVVDNDGNPLPPGEPGEILIRGYNVMRGYLDNPDATAQTIDADGWLRSGDIGILDEAGYIQITDRKKDMFIVGGFNAYPAEIEAVLGQRPDVAQIAVVGVPDDRLGEVGLAYLVPLAGATIDPDEFLRWAREQMANYKVPRYLELVDALPLNATGKVDKVALRIRARLARGPSAGA